jgi:hypothetical protein
VLVEVVTGPPVNAVAAPSVDTNAPPDPEATDPPTETPPTTPIIVRASVPVIVPWIERITTATMMTILMTMWPKFVEILLICLAFYSLHLRLLAPY